MKKEFIQWRKATDKEIKEGLDHPVNKGMIIDSSEWKDVPDEELSEDQVKHFEENYTDDKV